MKLYQVAIRKDGLIPFRTTFHTAQTDARKAFVAAKKHGATREVTLSSVEIQTNLKAQDWVQLIESDSIGGEMTLAPRDLLQEWTREDLDSWKRPR